jgi:hypothetical protein
MAILGAFRPRRGSAGWSAAVLVWLIVCGLNLAAAQTISREYQLKAVFLYNFTQFTEWPTNAFSGTNSPVVIGVLGKDPFGRILDDTVRGETIHGRPLVVQRYTRAEDIKECHVLFVSASEGNQLSPVFTGVQGRPILTVGETDNFVLNGGIVRFAIADNKIRLRINVDAAKRANLSISSKLLRLADIVTAQKD